MSAAHKSKKLNDAKKDEKQRYRHIYYDMNPFHESQKLTDVEKKRRTEFYRNIHYAINTPHESKKVINGKKDAKDGSR